MAVWAPDLVWIFWKKEKSLYGEYKKYVVGNVSCASML
jgi:hypothetical protein